MGVDAALHGGWRDVVLALEGVVDRRRVAVLAAYWSADAQVAAREFGVGVTLLKELEGLALIRRLERIAARRGSAPRPTGELPEVEAEQLAT
ncbi:MAG: hypothetical protein C4343_00975, partial [Chloroflexota bacterium]